MMNWKLTPTIHRLCLCLVFMSAMFFSHSSELQAQTCPTVQAFPLQDVVGFPQTDSLVVCGMPDTLAILIFPSPEATYPNGLNVTFELPAGMQYAGFAELIFPGPTVTEADVSDIENPTVLIEGVGPGQAVALYIGVQANCELVPPEDAPVNLVVDYVANIGGTLAACNNEIRPLAEYNSAFKIPVVNILDISPTTLTFSDFSSQLCDTLIISQDGIDSYLDSFNITVRNLNLVDLNLESIEINSMPFDLADFQYDVATFTGELTVTEDFFTGNFDPNGLASESDMDFNENEQLEAIFCFSANSCTALAGQRIVFGATYRCGEIQCFEPDEARLSLNFIADFTPEPLASATIVQNGQICGDDFIVEYEVSSDLAGNEGVYTDLEVNVPLCGGAEQIDGQDPALDGLEVVDVSIFNYDSSTFVPLPTDAWSVSSANELEISTIPILSDIDGNGGLADLNLDSRFDDLPGDEVLRFRVNYGFVCSDQASRQDIEDCGALACVIENVEVAGRRSCNTRFQQTAPLMPTLSFSYGAIAITSNAGPDGPLTFGYNYEGVGAGAEFGGQSGDAVSTTITHGYQFAAEGFTGCNNPETSLEVILSGPSILTGDAAFVPGSAGYYDNGTLIPIPDSDVTEQYASSLPGDTTYILTIDAGAVGNPLTEIDSFTYDLEFNTCSCITRRGSAQSRILESCPDCPTPDCSVVKSCISYDINVATSDCCMSVGSACPIEAEVVEVCRINPGFTDKSMTTQLDIADIPIEDKRRFLPGDTAFVRAKYTITDASQLIGLDDNINFIMNHVPITEDLGAVSIQPDPLQLPSIPRRRRSSIQALWIMRDGTTTMSPLTLPTGTIEEGCIEFTGLIDFTPLVAQAGLDLTGANNNGLNEFSFGTDRSVNGGYIFSIGENCIQEFIAASDFQDGDMIFIDWWIALQPNPGQIRSEPEIAPAFNASVSGDFSDGRNINSTLDCVEPPLPYEFHNPGPVVMDSDVTLTMDGCFVDVKNTYTLSNATPDAWYTSEYRPISGVAFTDITIPANLAYCGPMNILDYQGNIVGTVPESQLDFPGMMQVDFAGTSYYVANPDSLVGRIRIQDAEFIDGAPGTDLSTFRVDQDPVAWAAGDQTLVGGTFPLFGSGLQADQCNFMLSYQLKRICQENVEASDFTGVVGSSYTTTENYASFGYRGRFTRASWLTPTVVSTSVTGSTNATELTRTAGTAYYWPYGADQFNNFGEGDFVPGHFRDDTGSGVDNDGDGEPDNIYGVGYNPNNQLDTLLLPNFVDNSSNFPSLSVDVDFNLIADAEGADDINYYEVCANTDGGADLTNMVSVITVPAAVQLIGVNVPDENGAPLAFTQIAAAGDSTTYQITHDAPGETLSPGECYRFAIRTELLFCPIGLDFPTRVNVISNSSCLEQDLTALLSAASAGACVSSLDSYEYISDEADLQVEFFIPENGVDNIGLCDEFCIAARVKNVRTSLLIDLNSIFVLPNGLEFVPGSWEISYPGGPQNYGNGQTAADIDLDMCSDTEAWESIPDPTQIAPTRPRGTTYAYDWGTELLGQGNGVLDDVISNGLPGVSTQTSMDNTNEVAFRFRVRTVCDEFTSGTSIRYISTALDPCETTISSNLALTAPIIVEDANPADFAQLLTVADPADINCGEMGTLDISTINTSSTAEVTLGARQCINVPTDGIIYEAGSLVFLEPAGFDAMAMEEDILGPDGVTVVEKEICFNVPDNLAPGQFYQIAFNYMLAQDVGCDQEELSVEIATVLEDQTCAALGVDCSVGVLNSINPTIPINFLPPLNIENFKVVSACDDDPSMLVYSYMFDLTNPGPDFMNTVEIDLIRDLDQDGILDDFETDPLANPLLAGPVMVSVDLPMGESTTVMGELNVPANIGCPAFLRVRQNSDCSCDEAIQYIDGAIPEFISDLGDEILACQGSDFVVDLCGDFAPSAGVEYVYDDNFNYVVLFMGNTIMTIESDPLFTPFLEVVGDQLFGYLPSSFGAQEVATINFTVNQGFCQETYSVNIRLAPDLDLGTYDTQTVCTGDKTTLDLNLAATLEANADITWSPTTFLDDPTSPRPQICNPTMDIDYTVIVALNDSDVGCADTIMYPVQVLDPGVLNITCTGETACFDETNPIVITADPGFSNYTFYVLVNGEEFVVQNSTNNVYNVPGAGGTYFVRADDGSECGLVSAAKTVPGLPCGECPDITNPITPLEVCLGETIDSLKVFTGSTSIDGIAFVQFDDAQTLADDIYDYSTTGGTLLGSTTPMVMMNPATMMMDTMATLYDIASPTMTGDYYIYAILNPTPEQASCRPFTEIQLTVNPAPTADMAMDAACEDENGMASFTLSDYDASIDVDGGNTVTYHLTQANAEGNVNAITANPYMTSVDITLYARVENADGCFAVGELVLTANQLPGTPISGGDKEFCEGDTAPALSVQNPGSGFTVEWYADPMANTLVSGGTLGGANAEIITLTASSTPALPTAGNSVTLYAEVVDDATGCTSPTRTAITLTANPTPPASPAMLMLCEEVEGQGQATFDLSQVIDDVNAAFTEGTMSASGVFSAMNGMGETMEMTFHSFSSDAVMDINALPNPETFTNLTAGGQAIFVRVENTVTGCFSTAAVTLVVKPIPEVAPASLTECEDVAGSNMATFDLTSVDATVDVDGGNTVTYHNSEADAIAAAAAISPANAYTSGTGMIFARVEDPATGCFSTQMVTLMVNTNPDEPATPINGEYCADEDVPTIGASGVPSSVEVTWYQDAATTMPVTGAITSGVSNEFITLSMVSTPTAPAAGMSVTIYAQVTNTGTSCVSDGTLAVTLTQNPSPTAANAEETLCENNFNSRVAEFDLSLLTDDVNADFTEGTASAGGVFTGTSGNLELTYHLSMSDADGNINALPNPENFTNTTLGTQTLFTRVEDTNTGCYITSLVNLNVSGLPDADNLEQFVCEDPATPGTRAGVDLTSLEMLVAGGNPVGSYTIEWYSDAGLTTAVMPANNVSVSDGESYYARIIFNDAPMCENVAVVTYEVGPAPPQQDLTPVFCEDGQGSGQITINLTTFNLAIAGGTSAIVNWYEDAGLLVAVADPTSVTVTVADNGAEGNIFYADISDGVCTNTGTLDITVNEQPVANAGADKEVCAGVGLPLSDASISVSASMGEWEVIISPVGGDGFILPMGLITDPATAVFVATVPGTYTLRLTTDDPDGPCDANSDEVEVVVNPLPVPAPMPAEVCVNDILMVDANTTDGTPTYSYVWTDLGTGTASGYSLNNTSTAVLTVDATGANAGTVDVEVTVTDSKGCVNSATTTITINPLPEAAPQPAEVCVNDILMVDGMPSGGTPDYAAHVWTDLGTGTASGYSLSNTDMQIVTLDATGAVAGTVDLEYEVTDSKGCSITATVTLTINPLPVPAPQPAEVCVNDMVMVDANTTDGTPAYTHVWMDLGTGTAAGYSLVNTSTQVVTVDATGATAGTVDLQVMVTDSKGCVNTAEVTVLINPLPEANPPMAEICVGESVSVDGLPSGGTPGYTHAWTDLGTGTASGYTLQNVTSQVVTVETSGVAINAGAGTVDLQYEVTDSKGCSITATTTVRINPLPVPLPQPEMVCVGDMVVVNDNPTQGTTPYITHEWVDLGTGTAANYTLLGTTMPNLTVDASTTTDAQAGTVNLQYTVTDVNGCSQSATVTVTINPLPEITPMDANITCDPPQEVMISVTTTAQSPSYEWSGPGIVAGGNMANPTVNLPGTYTVIVTDGMTGCMNTAQVFVTQDPLSKCLPATFEIKVKGGE